MSLVATRPDSFRSDLEPQGYRILTFRDALSASKPNWLVEGLVSSSVTLITGQPKAGKSALAQSLVASILEGREFLGRPIGEVSRVFVIATDPDAVLEYAERLAIAGVSYDLAMERLFLVPATRLDKGLCSFIEHSVRPAAGDLLILDHLSDMAGDFNSQKDVADIFAAVRTAAGGAAVVVLAHSTTTTGPTGHSAKKALGSTVIEAKARWIVRIARRGDDVTLVTQGNSAQGEVISATMGAHPLDFRLAAVQSASESSAQRRERSRATSDRRKVQFEWYAENCVGQTKAQAARMLAVQFGDKASTWSNRLTPRGWLGQMASSASH